MRYISHSAREYQYVTTDPMTIVRKYDDEDCGTDQPHRCLYQGANNEEPVYGIKLSGFFEQRGHQSPVEIEDERWLTERSVECQKTYASKMLSKLRTASHTGTFRPG